MVNLLALILFSFLITLTFLALLFYFRARARAALFFVGAGAFFLFAFLLLASRFAVQIFGVLPIALDLPQFAFDLILPVVAAIVGGAAAVGILLVARQRWIIAFGLMLLGLVLGIGVVTRLSQPPPPAPTHPGIAEITLPENFRVQIFAAPVQEPSALAFDDAGNLYYTELVDGNVVRLRDTNSDGIADERNIFASDFKNPRGLAWHDDKLYVSSRGQINTLRDTNGDGVADENKTILDGLFSLDVQHSNNGIAFGPDGKLYIAIGGPRVGQLELKEKTYWYEGQPRDEWQFAGVLQVDADGKNPKLFARGLRNPYALAFDADGNLFATDNGDETIPVPDGDELNLVEANADYGYPYFFGIPPAWSDTHAPIIPFIPHTAPTGLTVYNAVAKTGAHTFPEIYRNTIFTALYWRARPGSPYREVVCIVSEEKDGALAWNMRDFMAGLDRPVALAVGPDGALYVTDMRGGKADPEAPGAIYRVSYENQ